VALGDRAVARALGGQGGEGPTCRHLEEVTAGARSTARSGGGGGGGGRYHKQ
jgi:hypothetical protein